MTAKQIVETGAAYAGITNRELGERLGWSPQVMCNRLKTGKFTVDEWEKIAEALGAKLSLGFVFPDGKQI